MPALKIENVENIAARAKFITAPVFSGQGQYAYCKVTFEQKETGHGLGSDHPLDGLTISGTLSKDGFEGCQSIGWDVSYEDVYSDIDLRTAERMYHFLSQLDKAMKRADEKMGRCLSYGQFVVRVCNLLGVDRGLADNGNRTHRMDAVLYDKIGEFQYPIDERIREKNADWYGAKFWYQK